MARQNREGGTIYSANQEAFAGNSPAASIAKAIEMRLGINNALAPLAMSSPPIRKFVELDSGGGTRPLPRPRGSLLLPRLQEVKVSSLCVGRRRGRLASRPLLQSPLDQARGPNAMRFEASLLAQASKPKTRPLEETHFGGLRLPGRELSDTFNVKAFWRVAPSVRLSLRAIAAAGVFCRASDLSSRTSCALHTRLLDLLTTLRSRSLPPPYPPPTRGEGVGGGGIDCANTATVTRRLSQAAFASCLVPFNACK
jgi:hypothetical protein